MLFDEDAGALAPLLSHLNLNAVYAPDIGLGAVGDPSVAAHAKSDRRIVITFNHRHYFPENRGIRIQDCPGIIAAKRSNQNPQSIALTALSIEQLLIQLGQNVRVAWWFGVKISVTNNGFLLRKHSGGVTLQYRIIPDSRGVLWFKTRK